MPARPDGNGMEPTSSNKRKFATDFPMAPTVFISPELKTDVRITVFEQEFHVHSIILKLHSAYFRKFLDSPDKSGDAASSVFQYEYVSVVDTDGNWGLESTAKVDTTAKDNNSLVIQPELETEAFRLILCAMYNRPYTIHDMEELERITNLADFYCALPILSATLVSGLMGSPIFKGQLALGLEFFDLIHLAKKLRNPVFFRECFVQVVAQWEVDWKPVIPPGYLEKRKSIEDDAILFRLVTKAVFAIYSQLLKVNERILVATTDGLDLRECMKEFDDDDKVTYGKHPLRNPKFYRKVMQLVQNTYWYPLDDLEADLGRLMQNNLSLDKTRYGPGEGIYEDCFFCARIDDNDMPWDATQVDW